MFWLRSALPLSHSCLKVLYYTYRTYQWWAISTRDGRGAFDTSPPTPQSDKRPCKDAWLAKRATSVSCSRSIFSPVHPNQLLLPAACPVSPILSNWPTCWADRELCVQTLLLEDLRYAKHRTWSRSMLLLAVRRMDASAREVVSAARVWQLQELFPCFW